MAADPTPRETGDPWASEVRGEFDRLLSESDPRTTERNTFLGARFDGGLAWLHFRRGEGGLEADASQQVLVDAELATRGAPDPFPANPIGIGMVAPTLAHHGTASHRAHLRRIYTGEEIWCQLFSEPGAGSDLASLATRARPRGEGWVVSGQKVWTSLGHLARYGLLLARTDPDQPKHRGLSCFVLDMTTPGVTVRPLRQMTGEAEFNEVFLDDVGLDADALIGEPGDGWNVAVTTLLNERSAIGAAVAQHAADPVSQLLELYRQRYQGDPVTRDRVVRLWIDAELLRLTTERAQQMAELGRPGAESSVGKLLGCELNQRVTNATVDLLGPNGMLTGESPSMVEPAAAMGTGSNPQRRFLRARANTIEGGTSEIMRNVLGERVLGLPPEPRADSGRTWAETQAAQGGSS